MEIRFAMPEDVPEIIELVRQAGQACYASRPEFFRADARRYAPSQVFAMLDKPETAVFVAVADEKLLGYCFCRIKTYYRDPVIADRITCCIDGLCVDEKHRRKGIGTRLYDAACTYARQRNCAGMTLNVYNCNEGAVGFCEKLGLKPQSVEMETVLE